MKNIVLSYLLLGVSTGCLTAVPFQEIVSEDVELLVTVRDFSESRAQWEQHPIAGLFEDEAIMALLQADEDEIEESKSDEPTGFTEVMEAEFGLSYDELFELFPGQACLAFYNISEQMINDAAAMDLSFMAEFTGDEARMSELMQIQFKRNAAEHLEWNPLVEHEMIEESFIGETLYFDETFDGVDTYIEDGYALVDGIFILATPESRLREVVEAIKEGEDDSLARSDVYLRSREESGAGDVGVYLNLEAIIPPLNQTLLEFPMVNQLAFFGVTPKSFGNALDLEALQALYVDMDLVDEGLLSHFGMLYSRKSGFLSLLTYTNGELPEARYVPEDALSCSISMFDGSEMLANLEKLLSLASPTIAPLLNMQLQQMQTNTGVDVRASILENLGGHMVSLSMSPEAQREALLSATPQQLLVIAVKDTQALSEAIETFKDLAPGVRSMIEEQAYAGETIYSIKGQGDPNLGDSGAGDVSYVVTRSSLIVNVGSIGVLHKVLTRMEQGEDGLWQNSNTEALFERIERSDAVGRSYMDVEQTIEPFIDALVESGAFDGISAHMNAAELLSDWDVPYRMVSEVNEAPDGLFGRALMIKSEERK